MKHKIITIDGPAGSGKARIASYIAKKWRYYHLDSGILYRRLAYLFLKNNIKLEFQNFKCPNYEQVFPETFIPNLSIIDLLFQNGSKSLSIINNGI